MKRVILDTNIYGLIAVDKDRLNIVNHTLKSKIIFYGTKLNRNELRAVPKTLIVDGKNLRVDLLTLFDGIVGEHVYPITKEMEEIADGYYKTYVELGGSKSKESIISDFIIVACASVHNLDIVVSDDEKSMLAENALKSYKLVNSIIKKKTPNFIGYLEFKKILRGGMSNELV